MFVPTQQDRLFWKHYGKQRRQSHEGHESPLTPEKTDHSRVAPASYPAEALAHLHQLSVQHRGWNNGFVLTSNHNQDIGEPWWRVGWGLCMVQCLPPKLRLRWKYYLVNERFDPFPQAILEQLLLAFSSRSLFSLLSCAPWWSFQRSLQNWKCKTNMRALVFPKPA